MYLTEQQITNAQQHIGGLVDALIEILAERDAAAADMPMGYGPAPETGGEAYARTLLGVIMGEATGPEHN